MFRKTKARSFFSSHFVSKKKKYTHSNYHVSLWGSTPKGNTMLVCRRAFEFLAYTQTLAQNVCTPSIIPSAKEAH